MRMRRRIGEQRSSGSPGAQVRDGHELVQSMGLVGLGRVRSGRIFWQLSWVGSGSMTLR